MSGESQILNGQHLHTDTGHGTRDTAYIRLFRPGNMKWFLLWLQLICGMSTMAFNKSDSRPFPNSYRLAPPYSNAPANRPQYAPVPGPPWQLGASVGRPSLGNAWPAGRPPQYPNPNPNPPMHHPPPSAVGESSIYVKTSTSDRDGAAASAESDLPGLIAKGETGRWPVGSGGSMGPPPVSSGDVSITSQSVQGNNVHETVAQGSVVSRNKTSSIQPAPPYPNPYPPRWNSPPHLKPPNGMPPMGNSQYQNKFG